MATNPRVTTFVEVPPDEAFRVFTEEVDSWWRRGKRFRGGGPSSVLAFRTIEGERYLVEDGNERFAIGRVLVWEPGKKLVFEWRARNFRPGEKTEVEVSFERANAGTRVTLEHRGFESLRPDHPVRHGLEGPAFAAMMGLHWGDLATTFRLRANEHSRTGSLAPGRRS